MQSHSYALPGGRVRAYYQHCGFHIRRFAEHRPLLLGRPASQYLVVLLTETGHTLLLRTQRTPSTAFTCIYASLVALTRLGTRGLTHWLARPAK